MSQASGFAKLWAAIAAMLALMLGVTVALTFTEGPEAAVATTAAGAAPAAVDVTLTEFAFEPGELTAPAGVPLTFTVANIGSIAHDFVITDVTGTETLQAGDTAALQVDALEPGTYEVVCTEAGHAGAGMRTTLTVSADAAAPATAAAETDHASHGEMSPEQMVAMHEQGVADFPVETEGSGNQPLEPEIAADGTKVFELAADELTWETEPGELRDALAYNGQVPGPRIDVDLGDQVRIVLRNELEVPTSLHLHGLVLPNEMDGVPGLTQPSVMPGESFTYEFTARNAGSHMYHSHFDSAKQVPSGLLGAFVVHGPDEPHVDVDTVMVLNDGPLGYTLNGKSFPATQPITVKQGQTVRVRYMNEGLETHPMHLHGLPQRVIAKDGYPLDAPYTEDNVLIAPGDRVDVLIEADELGAWAWHCHILSHAEGAEGMFGMVSAVIVEE